MWQSIFGPGIRNLAVVIVIALGKLQYVLEYKKKKSLYIFHSGAVRIPGLLNSFSISVVSGKCVLFVCFFDYLP